jgi:phosphatidylglycerophosphate synthase
MADSFKEAQRLYNSPLAAAEKRALVWLAARMPRRINSDHLTGLGFAAMITAGVSFGLSRTMPMALWGVVGALALNWFGDSLDGTLARVRGHQRPRFGFYIDHILDSFGTLVLLSGMAVSGHMTPLVAAAVAVAYFLLSIEIFLATYCVGRFHMSFWGAGPTELRILLAAGTLMLFVKPVVTIAGVRYGLFDVGGVVAAAVLVVTAVVATVRHTAALYRAEPMEPLVSGSPSRKALHDFSDDVLRVAE